MARAINSFPVPLSPVIRTVASLGATRITCAVTPEIALEEPTISSNMDVDRTSSRKSSVSSSSPPLIPALARLAASSVKLLDPRSVLARERRGPTEQSLIVGLLSPPSLILNWKKHRNNHLKVQREESFEQSCHSRLEIWMRRHPESRASADHSPRPIKAKAAPKCSQQRVGLPRSLRPTQAATLPAPCPLLPFSSGIRWASR